MREVGGARQRKPSKNNCHVCPREVQGKLGSLAAPTRLGS